MQQEDYNSMMRHPFERTKSEPVNLPICPKCKEKYLGDGVKLCVECDSEILR